MSDNTSVVMLTKKLREPLSVRLDIKRNGEFPSMPDDHRLATFDELHDELDYCFDFYLALAIVMYEKGEVRLTVKVES